METNSKYIIYSMLDDIKKHKNRDKNQLMAQYVQKRLNKQMNVYYQQLMSSVDTLSYLSEKRVVKNLIK